MLESLIQSKILRYLQQRPDCWVVKTIQCNERGVPDLLLCYRGEFIGLEVKSDTGKATKIQLAQMQRIRAAGGTAEIVTSIEDVKDILE